jgi:ABC-2 type transport system ATP-binding protein
MMPPVTREVTVNEDLPEAAGGENGAPTEASPAIEVSHLRKTYGQTVAVDDVSFAVPDGEIFGLLGPNGAGKTTTVECAVGLLTADSGQVRILGLDPAHDRERLRLVTGVQLQSDRGVTILLVTHNMEEADRLCDTVALVDQGRIVAAGTPQQLAQQADARKQVHFVPSRPFDDGLLTELPEVSGVEHHGRRVQVSGTGDFVSTVITALSAHGVTTHDLELSSATLEDAFIQLTGHRIASAPRSEPQKRQRDRAVPRKSWPLLPSQAPRRAFAKLTQAEARLAWRRPIGLALGLALPLLLLALFASIPSFRRPERFRPRDHPRRTRLPGHRAVHRRHRAHHERRQRLRRSGPVPADVLRRTVRAAPGAPGRRDPDQCLDPARGGGPGNPVRHAKEEARS